MDDILILVLKQCDSMSSIRLLKASKTLWYMFKYESLFWISMEADLLFQSKYMAFKFVNKHLGCRRRVLKWATYLESQCTLCNLPMFQICSGTFPINMKLCNNCQSDHLITERVISRYVPYYVILDMRKKVKYCWLFNDNSRKMAYFYRPHVIHYLQSINFF